MYFFARPRKVADERSGKGGKKVLDWDLSQGREKGPGIARRGGT